MGQWFDDLFQLGEIGTRVTINEVIFSILISFGLGILIGLVYYKTHRGQYYSQSFVHTLIIVQVVIAIVIVAIGSNIARAFSLAGALSIIRFRSAIRDPRDVAFIFFAMGTGLAIGAGLYAPAVVFTLLLSALIFLLYKWDFAAKKERKKLLKISIPENLNYEGLFDDIFARYTEYATLISVRTTSLGTMFELLYSIRNVESISDKLIIDEIRTRNGNLNVSIVLDQQELEF